MATQLERRRATYQKLLGSSRKLFEAKGFDATTVDEIVAEADLAKGTFYQHFETKVDVLIDLAREQVSRWLPAQLTSLDAGKPTRAVLRDFLEGIAPWFEANRQIADAALWQLFRRAESWDDLLPMTASGRFLETVFAHAQRKGEVRRDLSAHDLALLWSGLLFGVVLAWAKDPAGPPLLPLADQGLAVFLEGAVAADASP